MQPGDEVDPLFGGAAVRSQIPALYANGAGMDEIDQMIGRGESFDMQVLVCGVGSKPQSIYLMYGPYADYGCF